jgi:hypothetical protein
MELQCNAPNATQAGPLKTRAQTTGLVGFICMHDVE